MKSDNNHADNNSSSPKITLETKTIEDIKNADFIVPSYQRGYRWSAEEVERLLQDLEDNGDRNYCLQPIVVRKEQGRNRLIDGQQRLTTIYLIFRYIYVASNHFLVVPNFSILYETRPRSAEFLSNIEQDLDHGAENIDFYFMSQAYRTIEKWFSGHSSPQTAMNDIYKYLLKQAKIIWYEVDESEDEHDLYKRLNIGKIPLTNAELIKAMFLSKDSNSKITSAKQEEIAIA